MPRVHTRTRKRKEVKREMRCASCKIAGDRGGDNSIRVGDTYYTWSRKMGRSGVTYFQHLECGSPKRSQLSSRKTVAIEDAIDSANDQIAAWVPELDEDGTYSGSYEDVSSALEAVASVATDVGQEYQDGFDNMPEGLNQGDTGQAMEAIAQELESYAQDLEGFEPQTTEPDLPERDEGQDEDEWRDACETALSDWADDVRSEASDAMSEMPEYQG